MKRQLKQWGYDIQTDTFGTRSAQDGCLSAQDKKVLKAFKRHFSFNCNPQQCKEDQIQKIDLIWIYGLNAKYRR
jgi:protein-tyrosine-phosphatase